MRRPSIRLRFTLGALLILGPFLFALSHLLIAVGRHDLHFAHRDTSVRPLYVLSVLAVAVSALGVWLIVGRTLSPIRDLAAQAQATSPEEARARLVAPSSDPEIAELVDTLNALLERVAEAGEAKSRFYAAVSHELRTPLQALSGHLELAAGRPRTQEEYAATVAEALEQTRKLGALVEGVLLLHRLDAEVGTQIQTVRVDDALELCREEGMVWIRRQPFEARCLAAHLDILLSNLLSNALRHGVPGGSISLTTSNEGLLVVANEVAAPMTTGEGNGLGLPLMQAICRANGWTLNIQREGVRFAARVDFHPE